MKQEKTQADLLVETAESKIGCNYKFGSTGPNEFDCSGFVQWCHNHIGVNKVPRTSGEQYNSGSNATGGKGSLVFFKKDNKINHVGICDGKGNMINAQCSGVKRVKISDVKPNWGMGEKCGYKTFL